MALYGGFAMTNRIWTTDLDVSPVRGLAEQFTIDNSLPVLGTDPHFPEDQIVVARGRLVGVKPVAYSDAGAKKDMVVTLADGVNVAPQGYAPSQMFRAWPNHTSVRPMIQKQYYIHVPMTAYNNEYGVLKTGDKVTAHYGSLTSLTPTAGVRGRVVKFRPKTITTMSGSLANCPLSGTGNVANIRALEPKFAIGIGDDGKCYATSGFTWNTSAAMWVANFSGGSGTGTVIYEYGQPETMIAGEVYAINHIESSSDVKGWLKWVVDNFGTWEFQPQQYPNEIDGLGTFTTAASTLTEIDTNVYQIKDPGKRRLNPGKSIVITISGTDIDGSTSLSDETLAVYNSVNMDWSQGPLYTVDTAEGIITLDSRLTVTAVSVSCYYEKYMDGVSDAPGQMGLTDGGITGITGLPASLEYNYDTTSLGTPASQFYGDLRVVIY